VSDAESAWGGYWEGEPAAQSGATLANLAPGLCDILDAPWRVLASGLPPKARVLDLATGGGVVLGLLQRERGDLHLLGVDAAAKLPTRPGMMLQGGISTDALPFADASFDAATSRFGIEYGPLRPGAAEAGRVLRPGGTLCLVIHHDRSRVLGHNRARREALHWAAYESGWVAKALNFARSRTALPLPTPPAFRSAGAEGVARFPNQSVAWEFLTGLVQVLDLGQPRRGEAIIRQLAARADDELARLDALAGAACDEARLAELTGALAEAGVDLDPARTIDEPDGVPLAWLIEGRRRA
jgi:ubiquinone/menaquinone biosynthesis C-methylase UbiE